MSNQTIIVILIILLVVAIVAAIVRACLKDKREAQCVEAVFQPLPKRVTYYEVDVVYHNHRHERLTMVRGVVEDPAFFCVRTYSGATHWISKIYVKDMWQRAQGEMYE